MDRERVASQMIPARFNEGNNTKQDVRKNKGKTTYVQKVTICHSDKKQEGVCQEEGEGEKGSGGKRGYESKNCEGRTGGKGRGEPDRAILKKERVPTGRASQHRNVPSTKPN